MARKRLGRRRVNRLTRGALLSLALGELGAPPARADSSAPIDAKTPAEGPVTADELKALSSQLAAAAVVPGRVARPALYTWTTREQVDALARHPVLLSRSESPQYGAAYFDQVVYNRALGGDPLAKLLRTQAFARARFAWSAPWATVFGVGGERYGDELVRVTLKPEAWIAVLYTSQASWEVVDLANRRVPVAQVLAHPERLAAVYFVHDQPVRGYALSMAGPDERMGYREYVLCNESMIARYEVRSEAVRRELALAPETVALFRRWLKKNPQPPADLFRWNERLVQKAWHDRAPGATPLARYEGALAFPDAAYLPTPAALQAIEDALRAARRDGPAIVHVPKVTFSPSAAATPAPPPRRRY
jgi:hypothetical protein